MCLISLACGLLLVSCAARDQIFKQLEPLPAGGLCRVAVLFPINRTDYSEGGVLYYRVLQVYLNQVPGLLVAQEGDVRMQYRDLQLRFGAEPDYEELKIMASRLGVQGLIQAEITRMDEIGKGDYSFPVLTVTLRLIDGRTGTTIWFSHFGGDGEQYRKVMHFGLVNTMTKLARIVSEEIIATWRENGFGQ